MEHYNEKLLFYLFVLLKPPIYAVQPEILAVVKFGNLQLVDLYW